MTEDTKMFSISNLYGDTTVISRLKALFGEAQVASLYKWVSINKLILSNIDLYINVSPLAVEPATEKELKGSVCITGKFNVPRETLEKRLQAAGYTVMDSVSRNTNFLLCGEKAGSKLTKAKKLGVEVYTSIDDLIGCCGSKTEYPCPL